MTKANSSEELLAALSQGFGHQRILVVGDLMLDEYCWGEVHRICPEAPVPVVHLQRRNWAAGGAANVAVNLAGLGLAVTLVGYVGPDAAKEKLLAVLSEKRVDIDKVITVPEWQTTTKTRIFARNQLMLRLDAEEALPVRANVETPLLTAVAGLLTGEERPVVVVLSDYAKGVLSPAVCKQIIAHANAQKIPVIVDPKGRDFSKYARATLISPNRAEMSGAVNLDGEDIDALVGAARDLCRGLEIPTWAITLSEKGIVLVEEEDVRHFPALAKEVYDVSGAGDTVVAVLAAGLSRGLDSSDTMYLANLAAGVVVARIGIYAITSDDLAAAVAMEAGLEQSLKICRVDDLLGKLTIWRNHHERIVFTNGCFDLLHAGHVAYLERARKLGDRLVVGLNTDRSVHELKGPRRPVIGQGDRARVLAALAAVDAVVLFDQATPIELIQQVRPDILAKGADYTEDGVVGGDFVKSYGGQVALVPLVEGKSSSAIIDGLSHGKWQDATGEQTKCTL